MTGNVEAYAAYHRKKERLTDELQVATAGLSLLQRKMAAPNAPELLGALVDACGVSHWGRGKRYEDAATKVADTIASLADQGVIQQVAAFDLFTRAVIQDVARFSARARQNLLELEHVHDLLKLSPANRWVSGHCCHDLTSRRLGELSARIDVLQTWLGWRPSARLAPTLSLFNLVRSIRNCIAHNDGMIGAELEETAASRETLDALTAFARSYTRRALPVLPRFQRGRRLQLHTVHAIMFGAYLYEIAKELNEHAVGLLSNPEFIDMAFYYSCVVVEHPFRTINHRSAENRVSYFLSQRYLRGERSPAPHAIIRYLTAQQLQDERRPQHNSTWWRVALTRHDDLKP